MKRARLVFRCHSEAGCGRETLTVWISPEASPWTRRLSSCHLWFVQEQASTVEGKVRHPSAVIRNQ